MGAFSGMSDATRGFSSNFARPGRYVVRIDESTSFTKEGVGRMWKNTLTVLAVDQAGDDGHSVGEQIHTFFKEDQRYPKMFFGKIMSFIAGVMDVSDAEVGEEETNQVLSEDNPMVGMVTILSAVGSPSKTQKEADGTPKMFTNYSWSPALTNEEIVAADVDVERFFPNGLGD